MNFLDKILNIKHGESKKVFSLVLFFTLSSFYMANIEIIGQSLFNARIGVSSLPLMFIFLSMGIFFTSVILYSFKIDNHRYFYLTIFFGFFLVHIILFILLKISADKIFVIVFYLISQIISTMLFTINWLIAQDVNDIESSKRLFPLASAGITIGFILSGFFLKYFVVIFSIEMTFLMTSLLLVINLIIVNDLLKKYRIIEHTDEKEDYASLSESIEYIFKNRFYLCVIIIGLLFPLIFFTNDYFYNFIVNKNFIDENAISSFFAFYYIVDGFISLFVRMFIISRLIIRFGVVKITYLLISLFLVGILLMFNDNIFFVFSSKLLISISQFSLGVTLFNFYYQVIEKRYKNKVILIMDTVGASLGMALGGGLTMLVSNNFISTNILNFAALFILLLILLLWVFNYRGFFKILQDNIQSISTGNISEIIGKNIPPDLEAFFTRNIVEGTTPTKTIILNFIKKINIKNKDPLIIESFKNGSISYQYEVIDYLFEDGVKFSLLKEIKPLLHKDAADYYCYNLFLNINKSGAYKEYDELFYSPGTNEMSNEITRIILLYVADKNIRSYHKIIDFFIATNDKINILKSLDIIYNFKEYYRESRHYVREIFEKYFSDSDIMLKVSRIISDYADIEYIDHFSSRFYNYNILNSIKLNRTNINFIVNKNTFLSNLYTLSIRSEQQKSIKNEELFNIVLKSIEQLKQLSVEERKIRDNFDVHLGKILLDEIKELKNTALSVIINFLLSYYNVPKITEIYTILSENRKVDYVKDIIKNVIPENISNEILNIIEGMISEESNNYIFDVLKIGVENEFLYIVYQYLGGVAMENRIQDKLEKLITLKNIPLFEDLNIDSLMLISSISEYVEYDENEIVVNEGDTSDTFFAVIHGAVSVIRGGVKLATLKDGSIFGEMGVIDNLVRTATIKTECKTLFLRIDGVNFIDLLKRYGSISFSVIRTISERLRNMLQKVN